MEGPGKRIIAYCTPAGFCINMEQKKRWIRDKVMHLERQSRPPHSKSEKKSSAAITRTVIKWLFLRNSQLIVFRLFQYGL